MKTTVIPQNRKYLVTLEGRMDTPSMPEVETELRPLMDVPFAEIVIDCSQLLYISSSGLRFVLSMQKAAMKNNGKLVLKGVKPEVKMVFDMTGFTQFLTIVDQDEPDEEKPSLYRITDKELTSDSMRIHTLRLMDDIYGHVEIEEVDDEEVYKQAYMLPEHAHAVRKVCQDNSVFISFRNAGENTLDRIKKGNPCKGHAILDKTIKMSNGKCTYIIPEQVGYAQLKGLVGHCDGGSRQLLGLWNVDKTIVDISLVDEKFDFSSIFTGDYDMDDLLESVSGKYYRIVANHPQEKEIINMLNMTMKRNDPKDDISKYADTTLSEYSLIRHGPQTSFLNYLLTKKKELGNYFYRNHHISDIIQRIDHIMSIGCPLCVFKEDGKAYILHNMEEIYSFYKDRQILFQVSIYYFFSDLKAKLERRCLKGDKYDEAMAFVLENIDHITDFKTDVMMLKDYIERLDDVALADYLYLILYSFILCYNMTDVGHKYSADGQSDGDQLDAYQKSLLMGIMDE